jgi:hypothetical protein
MPVGIKVGSFGSLRKPSQPRHTRCVEPPRQRFSSTQLTYHVLMLHEYWFDDPRNKSYALIA